jgi:hypothetical protein
MAEQDIAESTPSLIFTYKKCPLSLFLIRQTWAGLAEDHR